jgi:site-specific recombinase XerD
MTSLPPFAVEYLREQPVARIAVRAFHVWLKRSGRSILQLEEQEVAQCVRSLFYVGSAAARVHRRRRLLRYFEWLHARNLLHFDPRSLWPRATVQLSIEIDRFTKALEPTRKRATIRGYRSALRHLHVWLSSQKVSFDLVERSHVVSWLEWLHGRGFSACHRLHVIQCARTFFRWLEEQPDYRGRPADELFRSADLPKLPQYLPRPVPADLDRVLQKRFRKSRSLAGLGLLLMRRTGLRVGELRALPLHCIHQDHRGNTFLKVPLGKLDNERLVPLDRRTLRVINRLRVLGSTGLRGKKRTLLFQTKAGTPIPYEHFRIALAGACKGLVFAEPMTTHRLRHTYATTMLAAGVSLPALMKLLGHRDYRMTLRYAAITIETVAVEHADALEKIEARYELTSKNKRESPTAATTLADVARSLLAQVQDAGLDPRRARTLSRRLHRLSTAIQRLLRECAATRRRSD